jgi:hypothetical protein
MMKAILLLPLLLPLVVTGQEKLPPKYLRFVPLGELPPWKKRFEKTEESSLRPSPGQMPPSKIEVNGGELNGFGGNLYLRKTDELLLDRRKATEIGNSGERRRSTVDQPCHADSITHAGDPLSRSSGNDLAQTGS